MLEDGKKKTAMDKLEVSFLSFFLPTLFAFSLRIVNNPVLYAHPALTIPKSSATYSTYIHTYHAVHMGL